MSSNGNSNKGASGGIGFCGLLEIVFIVLKLIGVIKWSWLWVLSPIWLPTAVIVLIIILIYVWEKHWSDK